MEAKNIGRVLTGRLSISSLSTFGCREFSHREFSHSDTLAMETFKTTCAAATVTAPTTGLLKCVAGIWWDHESISCSPTSSLKKVSGG